jgi:hypothetical protein
VSRAGGIPVVHGGEDVNILTSDPGDLRELAEAADIHVELIPV